MTEQTFESFLAAHPSYARAYRTLEERAELLAESARSLHHDYPDRLPVVAGEILGFVERHLPPDFMDRFLERHERLVRMQERFDAQPSLGTLGAPGQSVPRVDYDIALLLSIVFLGHRFEIFQQLREFLAFVRRPSGRLAAVGIGTGYELALATRRLRGWTIEGYDTDPSARDSAARLLEAFGVSGRVVLGDAFPLDEPDPAWRGRYDALLLVEMLEHLERPLAALRAARACLSDDGHLFATMAINIAQEDHVFLYPTVRACRDQVAEAGLQVVQEWIAPMSTIPIPRGADREARCAHGNYIAVLRR